MPKYIAAANVARWNLPREAGDLGLPATCAGLVCAPGGGLKPSARAVGFHLSLQHSHGSRLLAARRIVTYPLGHMLHALTLGLEYAQVACTFPFGELHREEHK